MSLMALLTFETPIRTRMVAISLLLHRLSVYHVYDIIVIDISLKLDALGYISIAES